MRRQRPTPAKGWLPEAPQHARVLQGPPHDADGGHSPERCKPALKKEKAKRKPPALVKARGILSKTTRRRDLIKRPGNPNPLRSESVLPFESLRKLVPPRSPVRLHGDGEQSRPLPAPHRCSSTSSGRARPGDSHAGPGPRPRRQPPRSESGTQHVLLHDPNHSAPRFPHARNKDGSRHQGQHGQSARHGPGTQ